MVGEELLTTAELAGALKVRPAAIRSWVRRGLIPVVHIGQKTLRFSWPEVRTALDRAKARCE
jgi:predicted site-specific integrase-resolvase